MQDFRKLKVWEKGHNLTLQLYKTTVGFPTDERYGLTSQIRRSAASIPANIAEGCGRSTNPDFSRFLQIATGSASELQYHILLARDLDLIPQAEYGRLTDEAEEIKKMLSALINRLKSSVNN